MADIWDEWETRRTEIQRQLERGPEPELFGAEEVDGASTVVWTSSEREALALEKAGCSAVVAILAPKEARDPFAVLQQHADALARVGRFVLACGSDQVALREELARRLGRHRCWLVTWPENCQNAIATLTAHGDTDLRAVIDQAEPYPIEGLQRVRSGTLLALRHGPPPPVMCTGTRATDAILKLPGEGRLIVVTGIPNHGKSSWVLYETMHIMQRHQRRTLVFTPEMQPWEHYVALCSQVLTGKPFWHTTGIEGMSDTDIKAAEKWLAPRLFMLVCDAENSLPTLDWVLDRAHLAVLRDGVNELVIDPWNALEHQRGNMTESEYIGSGLMRLQAFGQRHGCNVWLIAHPTKQHPARPGEKIGPPGPYDISGSANWANKADLGLTVHNPDGQTQIHLWKSRFRRWGRRGDHALLEFDTLTGRYSDPLTPVYPMPGSS